MWLMQVLRQLLAGLAHIHAQGIIHRVCGTPVSVCSLQGCKEAAAHVVVFGGDPR